jgi:hypothetical protein
MRTAVTHSATHTTHSHVVASQHRWKGRPVKFEFIPEEEWDTLPEPDPEQARESEQPPPPAVLISTAAERMHTRARTDFHRVHSSLNRMLYTVQTSQPEPGLSFADTAPEPGVDVFRPEAFGDSRG